MVKENESKKQSNRKSPLKNLKEKRAAKRTKKSQ